jgi:hypothetical protein
MALEADCREVRSLFSSPDNTDFPADGNRTMDGWIWMDMDRVSHIRIYG